MTLKITYNKCTGTHFAREAKTAHAEKERGVKLHFSSMAICEQMVHFPFIFLPLPQPEMSNMDVTALVNIIFSVSSTETKPHGG